MRIYLGMVYKKCKTWLQRHKEMEVHLSDRLILGVVGNCWPWLLLLSGVRTNISWSFPCGRKMAIATYAIKHAFKAGGRGKSCASHTCLFLIRKVKASPEFPSANFLYFIGQNCVTLPLQVEQAREKGLGMCLLGDSPCDIYKEKGLSLVDWFLITSIVLLLV